MKKQLTSLALLVIVGLLYWKFPGLFEESGGGAAPQPKQERQTYRTDQEGLVGGGEVDTSMLDQEGEYAVFRGCKFIDGRNSDGDSFWVRMPSGAEKELRLYFVDTPESKIRRYPNGDTNASRVGKQGAYFGDLTLDETTAIGQESKSFTLNYLRKGGFTVLTRFELVRDDHRIHAYVRVNEGGRERYLHELLVERGLARIHTRGAEMPDGVKFRAQRDRLRKLEREAKRAGRGGWGV